MENYEIEEGDTAYLKGDFKETLMLTVANLEKDERQKTVATCYYVADGFLQEARVYVSALRKL
jgi:hypothetical protein